MCETDFVAKNENFQALFDSVLSKIAQGSDEIAGLTELDPTLAQTVEDEVKEFMGKT